MKILPLICLLLGLVACTPDQIDPDAWTHQYQLTQCADPWEGAIDLETGSGIIEAYLSEQGIKVRQIEVVRNTAASEACLACSCRSAFLARIQLSDADSDKLAALDLESYQQWESIP